jgi:hypothetical protein
MRKPLKDFSPGDRCWIGIDTAGLCSYINQYWDLAEAIVMAPPKADADQTVLLGFPKGTKFAYKADTVHTTNNDYAYCYVVVRFKGNVIAFDSIADHTVVASDTPNPYILGNDVRVGDTICCCYNNTTCHVVVEEIEEAEDELMNIRGVVHRLTARDIVRTDRCSIGKAARVVLIKRDTERPGLDREVAQ